MKKLLAALRTSEFWALLGQALVEALQAPVPEELKLFGWAYFALRVLGKVVKFVLPAPDGSSGWMSHN